jgi:hypothetical protein
MNSGAKFGLGVALTTSQLAIASLNRCVGLGQGRLRSSRTRYPSTVAAKVTWRQALAWRTHRQLLDPIGTLPVEEVVRQLGAVQAQVASIAELGIRVRRETSQPGEVGKALAEGRLIKTWAMRGALHLLTPEEGGAFLSLMAAGRSWERPSWERYFGVSPHRIERLRGVVRDALDAGPLTREELVAALTARRGYAHMGDAFRSGWGTLLKPFAWQGDLCFGPSQGNRVTFLRPEAASERWAGLPDPEAAAPLAVAAYLRVYGPATLDAFGFWMSGGYFGARKRHTWFDAIEDRLAEVEVDGDPAYVLAEDLDELLSTRPSSVVRLLPGFDQFVLGPGTGDGHVVPTARRAAVSRQSGWIAPVVLVGGVASGTWELDGDDVRVDWFGEAGKPPITRLQAEASRLSSLIGRDLRLATTVT